MSTVTIAQRVECSACNLTIMGAKRRKTGKGNTEAEVSAALLVTSTRGSPVLLCLFLARSVADVVEVGVG